MARTGAAPAAYQLTAVDWLEYPDDGRLYEILGGELHVSPPPGIEHQRIAGNLYSALRSFVLTQRLGEVFFAPTGVKLSEHDVPEPDIVVVLAEHAHKVGEAWIDGAPDLVVEILSPGTASRDLSVKREIYEQSGIPEYWIVDRKAGAVEVLTLEGGRYVRFGRFERGSVLRSKRLPELEIAVSSVLPG
jgi:Uma2 family endonuclease